MIKADFDKQDILKNISEKNTILAASVFDKAIFAEKTQKIVFTDFLDLFQQNEISEMLKKIGVKYNLNGGYISSERKIFVITFNQDDVDISDIPIKAFSISYNTNFTDKLNHRDILGSILSLGIERDKVGDILIHDGFSHIIVHSDISDYVKDNLKKISNSGVKVRSIHLNEVIPAIQEYKEINGVVPSLRLDCIIESGFSISRSEAVKLITSASAFVNWKSIVKPSFDVKIGDTVSVRGYGRIIFDSVKGYTKKNRLLIIIKKLL